MVQRRPDTRAALRLMRKLLKKQGFAPRLLATDRLRSYASACQRLRLTCPALALFLIMIGVAVALFGWRFFDLQRLLQRPRIEVH